MPNDSKIKLRILLPGGGVKGCFQVGCISEILKTNKYIIDRVYGCSIGAILAPLVATENIDIMLNLFNNINSINDVVTKRKWIPDLLAPFLAFFKLGAYKKIKLVDNIFNSLTPDQIELAKRKCHVVAYDILNNKEVWFNGDELREGIRCSSALWLAVPPISYKDTLFSDGGVTEIFPIDYILEYEKNESREFDGKYIFIDCCSRENKKNRIPQNALELMSNLHWNASSRLATFELQKLQDVLGDKLIIIKPDTDYLYNSLDINKERMNKTYEAGIQKAHDFLNQSSNKQN
jgi:predicted acylesterase/phospholipase RssA